MASELKIESRRGGSVMSELPISTLKQVVFGDNMDLDTSGDPDDAPNPFEKLREQGAIRAALGKSNPGASISLDWLRVDESDVDEESFELDKTPVIVKHERPQPHTFAKTRAEKLGITRTERLVTESGDTWLHAFNSRNELVDARLLLPEVE
jgi:hypothetical protein